eukprot:g112.t1
MSWAVALREEQTGEIRYVEFPDTDTRVKILQQQSSSGGSSGDKDNKVKILVEQRMVSLGDLVAQYEKECQTPQGLVRVGLNGQALNQQKSPMCYLTKRELPAQQDERNAKRSRVAGKDQEMGARPADANSSTTSSGAGGGAATSSTSATAAVGGAAGGAAVDAPAGGPGEVATSDSNQANGGAAKANGDVVRTTKTMVQALGFGNGADQENLSTKPASGLSTRPAGGGVTDTRETTSSVGKGEYVYDLDTTMRIAADRKLLEPQELYRVHSPLTVLKHITTANWRGAEHAKAYVFTRQWEHTLDMAKIANTDWRDPNVAGPRKVPEGNITSWQDDEFYMSEHTAAHYEYMFVEGLDNGPKAKRRLELPKATMDEDKGSTPATADHQKQIDRLHSLERQHELTLQEFYKIAWLSRQTHDAHNTFALLRLASLVYRPMREIVDHLGYGRRVLSHLCTSPEFASAMLATDNRASSTLHPFWMCTPGWRREKLRHFFKEGTICVERNADRLESMQYDPERFRGLLRGQGNAGCRIENWAPDNGLFEGLDTQNGGVDWTMYNEVATCLFQVFQECPSLYQVFEEEGKSVPASELRVLKQLYWGHLLPDIAFFLKSVRDSQFNFKTRKGDNDRRLYEGIMRKSQEFIAAICNRSAAAAGDHLHKEPVVCSGGGGAADAAGAGTELEGGQRAAEPANGGAMSPASNQDVNMDGASSGPATPALINSVTTTTTTSADQVQLEVDGANSSCKTTANEKSSAPRGSTKAAASLELKNGGNALDEELRRIEAGLTAVLEEVAVFSGSKDFYEIALMVMWIELDAIDWLRKRQVFLKVLTRKVFTTFMHEADRVIQWQPPQALNEIQELCDMTAHMPPPFHQKNSYKLEKERQNRQAYERVLNSFHAQWEIKQMVAIIYLLDEDQWGIVTEAWKDDLTHRLFEKVCSTGEMRRFSVDMFTYFTAGLRVKIQELLEKDLKGLMKHTGRNKPLVPMHRVDLADNPQRKYEHMLRKEFGHCIYCNDHAGGKQGAAGAGSGAEEGAAGSGAEGAVPPPLPHGGGSPKAVEALARGGVLFLRGRTAGTGRPVAPASADAKSPRKLRKAVLLRFECRRCHVPIPTGVPFVIEGLSGDRYHEECFVCIDCGKQVDGVEYKPTSQGPQCLECALPQCHQCKNLILGTVCVAKTPAGVELKFHTQCLRCIKCGHNIQYKYKAGETGFLCRSCANPHCSVCRKIIDGGSQYFLQGAEKTPVCAECHDAQQVAEGRGGGGAAGEQTRGQFRAPASSSCSTTSASHGHTTSGPVHQSGVSTAQYAVVAPVESSVLHPVVDQDHHVGGDRAPAVAAQTTGTSELRCTLPRTTQHVVQMRGSDEITTCAPPQHAVRQEVTRFIDAAGSGALPPAVAAGAAARSGAGGGSEVTPAVTNEGVARVRVLAVGLPF